MSRTEEHVGNREDLSMSWRPLRTGLAVGLILGAILGLLWVNLSHGAEGLPEDAPDLYDPAVVASYQLIRRAPYTTGGCQCESVVLASNVAWIQGKEKADKAALIFVIGFLRDLSNQRIVVIVETFIHPDGSRSIRAWIDEAWVHGKAASGEWTAYNDTDISRPMMKTELREYLRPLMGKITTRMGAGK